MTGGQHFMTGHLRQWAARAAYTYAYRIHLHYALYTACSGPVHTRAPTDTELSADVVGWVEAISGAGGSGESGRGYFEARY